MDSSSCFSLPLNVESKIIINEEEETIDKTFENNGKIIWENIIREYMEKRKIWEDFRQLKNSQTVILQLKDPNSESEVEYLNREIFPILLPALVDTLYEATEWDVLKVQKSRFNGIDYVVERIWNLNPKHSNRQKNYIKIFCIPFVRRFLDEHPRPIYPLSWIWTREEASLVIQSYVRGWMVRKRLDIQELRSFWKALKKEKFEEKNKLIDQKLLRKETKILMKKDKRLEEKMIKCLNDIKAGRKYKDADENDETLIEEKKDINYYEEFRHLWEKDIHYKVYPSPKSFDSNN